MPLKPNFHSFWTMFFFSCAFQLISGSFIWSWIIALLLMHFRFLVFISVLEYQFRVIPHQLTQQNFIMTPTISYFHETILSFYILVGQYVKFYPIIFNNFRVTMGENLFNIINIHSPWLYVYTAFNTTNICILTSKFNCSFINSPTCS